jgi:hypothetical protein
MSTKPPAPTQAFAPYADRAAPDASAHPPEWLVHWLTVLFLFLTKPMNAVRLLRSGRRPSWRYQARPDLPAGSAQEHFASVRGHFGNSIRWRCLRYGIGPGHKDWPELSRAIVAFGGSLEGFRPGLPPCGLFWWENPGVIPGMGADGTGFGAPKAPTATDALLQREAAANALPPALHDMQADAVHAVLPASWLPASLRQIFARAGPGPSTGPPDCPGLPSLSCLTQRGRSMASPAVLIRA